jgi:hypothetical protein
LFEWCQLNLDKGVVQINAQVNDFEGPLQCSPTKHRCHPYVRKNKPTNERPIHKPTNEKPTMREPHPQVRKREAPNLREKLEKMMTRV